MVTTALEVAVAAAVMSRPFRFQLICMGLSPKTTHFMVGPSWLTLAVWVDSLCIMANVGGTRIKGKQTADYTLKLAYVYLVSLFLEA